MPPTSRESVWRRGGGYAMRQIFPLKLAIGFGCLGVFVAGVGSAGLIPGPGRSGCYAEFDVAGATDTNTKNHNHVTCMDGDPTCDTDGQCQGSCKFFIQLCVNQTNVTGCTPSAFKRPANVKGKLLPVPVTTGVEAACGDAMPIEVPLKNRGKKQ